MKSQLRLLVVSLPCVLAACGAHNRPTTTPAPPVAPLPVNRFTGTEPVGREVEVRPDPSAGIINKAQAEVTEGEQALQDGRMVAARQHFDAAIDQLLAVPTGARSDAVVAAAFDQMLDRISALELLALREGDGLTEARSEPAAIDELLSAAVFERPQPAATTGETVRADLERTSHDLDIPANERVLSFVELFQGRLHDFMASGLARAHRYLPMIRRVFQEEGVPQDLAYVPLVESAFKPTALSRASARGMWQFMLGTGQEYGLRQNWFVDERADTEKATRAAAKYLKSLRDYFDGDWNLALASYNAGPGRIQRATQRARTTDYWNLTATPRFLPRETRDYVPMIMAATLIAKNPGLYGFDDSGSNPLAFENVSVPNALDLKIIAEWGGFTVEELRELNPELRRTTTPDRVHELKVPIGTAATIQKQLESADPLFVHFEFHQVRRGETLAIIARKYRVAQAELRQANDLGATARVKAGQSLMIPQRQASGLPTATARVVARSAPSVASAAPTRTSSSMTYRVQRGDTLFSIARRFDTTVDTIKQLNRLRNNSISIGDRLTVKR
ncbi:MAG: LysM peptidoglycan-binding domain-containing protein [Acidobacteriota bacterium]